jgi:hypothetical protein
MIQGFSGGLLNRELIYQTDLPSFQRDFASLKTLDHGTGPNITFTRASDATYFDANGTLQTASTDTPRFDHDPADGSSKGLLIEESRTNSIRNSQAGGATNGVIGSGGVQPTNWGYSSPTGIAAEIVATGTSNGFAYIDVKFSGTNTSGTSGSILVSFESTTQVVAASGQSWSGSAYVALVAGSFSGVTGDGVQLVERNVSGTFLASAITSIAAATSSLTRYVATRTLNQATTERVNVQVVGTVANNQAIDLTLRIAAPQLEQGAFATSYIPTTSASATRAADSAVVTPISSFYNQAEGTLFAELSTLHTVSGGFPYSIALDDNSNNNRIEIYGSSASTSTTVVASGSSQALLSFAGANTATTPFSTIVAYKADDIAFSTDNRTPATDTSATMPTGVTQLRTKPATNGHIRKIAYWPKRLTNTLLEQLTT